MTIGPVGARNRPNRQATDAAGAGAAEAVQPGRPRARRVGGAASGNCWPPPRTSSKSPRLRQSPPKAGAPGNGDKTDDAGPSDAPSKPAPPASSGSKPQPPRRAGPSPGPAYGDRVRLQRAAMAAMPARVRATESQPDHPLVGPPSRPRRAVIGRTGSDGGSRWSGSKQRDAPSRTPRKPPSTNWAVDESDAEFEVLEEARAGLFGRLRSEARVRARVRPTAPRAKEDRRDRRRRNRTSGEETGPRSGDSTDVAGDASGTVATAMNAEASVTVAPASDRATEPDGGPAVSAVMAATDPATAGKSNGPSRPRRRSGRGSAGSTGSGGPSMSGDESESAPRPPRRSANPAATASQGDHDGVADSDQQEGNNLQVPLDEQGQIARDFLTQLTAEFGVEATVEIVRPDEDTVDLHLQGSDLGLLIGPKGSTLVALQDLTRTVVHHQTGAGNGRYSRRCRRISAEAFRGPGAFRPAGRQQREAERRPHRPRAHVGRGPQGRT